MSFIVLWGCRTLYAHLLLHSVSLSHHGIQVVTFGNAVKHQLLNFHLQVGIGALQWTHLQETKQRLSNVLACMGDLAAQPQTHLVQVAGQAVVEILHGLFLISAVAMQSVELKADGAIEILTNRSWTGQRAACGKRDRSPRASPAGIHQRATGEGGLAVHRVTSHRDTGGHDGRLWQKKSTITDVIYFSSLWGQSGWMLKLQTDILMKILQKPDGLTCCHHLHKIWMLSRGS